MIRQCAILFGCLALGELVVFHGAKLGNFAISTLQNLYYFWFKVCKKRMLLNTKQDVSLTLRSFQ